MNKKDYIIKYIKSIIGDPIISAISEESDAINIAIELAQGEYWISFPFIHEESFSITHNSQSKKISSIESLKESIFQNQTIRDKSYYIGIIRIDKKDVYEGSTLASTLDAYLLNRPTLIDTYDLERFQLQKTKSNLLQGSIEFKIDEINKTIEYILPYGFLQFTVFHAFGFVDDELNFIEQNRLSLFAKMCCLRYLDIIISSRSSIELQGDFTVNIQYLENRKNELREEVTEIIKKTYTPVIL